MAAHERDGSVYEVLREIIRSCDAARWPRLMRDTSAGCAVEYAIVAGTLCLVMVSIFPTLARHLHLLLAVPGAF